jgi:hypothetical protein
MKYIRLIFASLAITLLSYSCNPAGTVSEGTGAILSPPTTIIVPTINVCWSGRMVICNNSTDSYKSYQWYLNNQAISGATDQYYTEESGLNGSYYVIVTTQGGISLTSDTLSVHTAP